MEDEEEDFHDGYIVNHPNRYFMRDEEDERHKFFQDASSDSKTRDDRNPYRQPATSGRIYRNDNRPVKCVNII